MTREDKLSEAANKFLYTYFGIAEDSPNLTPMDKGECKVAMIEFLKVQASQDNWVSVEEIEPEIDKRVLVFPTEENVVISRLIILDKVKFWQDDDGNHFDYHTVKHYQPLPQAPVLKDLAQK